MANPIHKSKLQKSVEAWNEWRRANPALFPNLSGANLRGANLSGADLSHTSLRRANLRGAILDLANLFEADLRGAILREAQLSTASLRGANLAGTDLSGANLFYADLGVAYLCKADLSHASFHRANLSGAELSGANLRGANLSGADLSGAGLRLADLTGACLEGALLLQTNLERTRLSECQIYGASVWDVTLDGAVQKDLVITTHTQPIIQVDNLEVAQFIYLILNNQKIRQVIDTITSKVVLILGRFTPKRKVVLEAIRKELRNFGRLPVLFDFEKPASQTTDETISTLAHMARFVIVDLTDAKSILQELRSIVPNSPSVVVQPLLLASQEESGMFDFFRKFPWVLEPVRYRNQKELIRRLSSKVIAPAEAKAKALASGL